METAFLTHRPALLAFFAARRAGHAAEDLLQELWMRLPGDGVDIEAPVRYLYRMANHLVIDFRRKQVEAAARDRAWSEVTGPTLPGRSDQPEADRALAARQVAERVLALLDREGGRVSHIFRRHRIDGVTQREVAMELGVSVGTVEGDLRRAYRVLYVYRERDDEE